MSTSTSNQDKVIVEDGIRKAICGYTWPGIEFGQPPAPKYTFFEYVDAVRFGDFALWHKIESETAAWWHPTMDRGAGALLHFAVDHGQLDMVKYLIEKRHVPVNQCCKTNGWTPLHRCAYMVHYKHAPYLEIFDYLLTHGADPELETWPDSVKSSVPLTAINLVVNKGYGWEQGQVRCLVAALIDKHRHAPKEPKHVYQGGDIGPEAQRVYDYWKSLPKLYPPKNWRPPPPSGYQGASGMRLHSVDPWRPAGDNDGSCTLRPMTPSEELAQQAKA